MKIYHYTMSAFDNEIRCEEMQVERETEKSYYINEHLRIAKSVIDRLHEHLNQMYSLSPDSTLFKQKLISKFKHKNANLTRQINMNLRVIEQLERSVKE